MKRILLALLFIGTTCLTFGQSNDTTTYVLDQVIQGQGSDMVVVLVNNRESPTRLYLKYLDESQQLIAEKYINLNRQGVRGQLESIFLWSGKLNILSSLYYPGPKRNHLLFKQYDLPSLKEAVSKKVDEAYTPGLYRIPFGYSLSPDSTKILFYSWSYAIPDDPARLSIHVLDQNLGLLWQEYHLLPFKNETLYIYGCKVDNEGKAYVLCENYEGKVTRNMIPREDKIKYFTLMMEPNVKELRIYPLELDENIVESLQFTVGNNNDLHAAGFFRKKNKRQYDGVFLFRVDGDSKKLTRKLLPISDEMYDQAYLGKGDEPNFNPQRAGFSGYLLDDLKLRKDGGLILLAEQKPETDRQNPFFAFNDILCLKIAPNRTLDWLLRVPKRQKRLFQNENLFSYAYFEKNENCYLLFNDIIGNLERRQENRKLSLYQAEQSEGILIGIKPDGTWKEERISKLANTGKSMLIYPPLSWPLDNRLMIYGEQVENDKSKGYFINLDWSFFPRMFE